jgi:aryl-alcohol dehydrogenase-like predicted oxidoreductase
MLKDNLQTRFAFRSSKGASRLAFGAGRLGAFWQGYNLKEQLRALDEALRLGINAIDTSDVYTRGLSERLIGRALRGTRHEVVICTKVGQIKTPWAAISAAKAQPEFAVRHLRSLVPGRTPADASAVPRCFHSQYIIGAVESSLRRLRTDFIDILLLHSPTAEDIAGDAWPDAIQSLLRTGKILHFGISCDDKAAAGGAIERELVSFIEIPVNALSTRFEQTIRSAYEKGIGVLARSPFDGGRVTRLAGRRNGGCDDDVTAAFLRSVTDRAEIVSTIVGMSTVEHVRRNLALVQRPISEEARLRFVSEVRDLATSQGIL